MRVHHGGATPSAVDSLYAKRTRREAVVLALEGPHAVTAVSLGCVEGFVGKLHDTFGTALQRWVDYRYADADSSAYVVIANLTE